MRATALVLSLFPSVVMADIIPLTSDVSDVTLYPQGATIVRRVPYVMPAGGHELILTDLPRSTDLSRVRVEMTGARMGAITGRSDYVLPRDASVSEEIEAAKAEVERLSALLRKGEADVLMIRLEIEAADARVSFLRGLGEGEKTAGMDAGALRDLAVMIGEESLAARQASFDAKFRADEAERSLRGAREALATAEQVLAALQTEDEGTVQLSIAASSESAAEGVITISYTHYDAGWMPTYDMRLNKQEGRLAIERGAMIRQGTGEDWADVDLTLSTVRPSEQIEPNQVFGWQRGVMEPPVAMPRQSKQIELNSLARMEEDAAGEPMVVAEAAVATPSYDGLAVTYDYPEPVSVANRADSLRITLGTVETDAEVLAFAAPLYDATGFMMAGITNDTGELILPTPYMNLYLDGRFMGQSSLNEVVPAGAEADIPFGAIDGLRLMRSVTRNEGDRGMISRSTELSEEVVLEVENLTGQSWPVKLFDRVPYSEQEELAIDWQASPRPSEQNYDNRQGVLAWAFELGAGSKQSVTLKYQLEWPEGKVLR